MSQHKAQRLLVDQKALAQLMKLAEVGQNLPLEDQKVKLMMLEALVQN